MSRYKRSTYDDDSDTDPEMMRTLARKLVRNNSLRAAPKKRSHYSDSSDDSSDASSNTSDSSSSGSSSSNRKRGKKAKKEEAEAPGESSLFTTVVNIVNNTLGVGVLCLPARLTAVGFGFGSSLIFFCISLSAYSFWMIGHGCHQTKTSSYSDFMIKSYKKKCWGNVVAVMLATLLFFVLLIYMMIVGWFLADSAKMLMGWDFAWWPWLVGSAVLFGPLAYLKSLDALKPASIAAVGCILYMTLLVVGRYGWVSMAKAPIVAYHTNMSKVEWEKITSKEKDKKGKFPTWYTFKKPEKLKGKGKPKKPPKKFMQLKIFDFASCVGAINSINVAANCHFGTPGYYKEMKNKGEFVQASIYSFSVVMAVNLGISVCGYLAFGANPSWNREKGPASPKDAKADDKHEFDFEHPQGFICDSFIKDKYRDPEAVGMTKTWQTAAMIGKLVMGISLVLTIPSVFQIFRYAIGLLLVGMLGYKEPPNEKFLTTVLLAVTVGLSVLLCTMPNGISWIDMLLNLVTVLAGNPIMFAFPGLAYLRNNPRDNSIHKMGAYFLILFCVFASGVGCLAVKNQIVKLMG